MFDVTIEQWAVVIVVLLILILYALGLGLSRIERLLEELRDELIDTRERLVGKPDDDEL